MRLLLDENLPQRFVDSLRIHGHDVVHAAELSLSAATDPVVFEYCCAESRMLVTADKKLTKFLAGAGLTCPSVLIARATGRWLHHGLDRLILANLGQIEVFVAERGNAIFTMTVDKPIRAALLPLGIAVQPTPRVASARRRPTTEFRTKHWTAT